MPRRLFYCDHYAIPLPPGHKFPMSKYRLVRDLLAEPEFYAFKCAPMASAAVVELAHEPEYVRDFIHGTLPAAALRRIGFPWSEGLVKRTLASVGGTLGATEDAFDVGWGGNLRAAPITPSARKGRASASSTISPSPSSGCDRKAASNGPP